MKLTTIYLDKFYLMSGFLNLQSKVPSRTWEDIHWNSSDDLFQQNSAASGKDEHSNVKLRMTVMNYSLSLHTASRTGIRKQKTEK